MGPNFYFTECLWRCRRGLKTCPSNSLSSDGSSSCAMVLTLCCLVALPPSLLAGTDSFWGASKFPTVVELGSEAQPLLHFERTEIDGQLRG